MPQIVSTRGARLVGPNGPLECQIAIVGEAPGRDEVRLGRPFVGASGKHLDMLMGSAGITRSQCYITNVVKERPPNNDIKMFIDLGKKIPIETLEYKEYEQSLREELDKTTANVIVAVGAVPLWALCRRKGIGKWRGSILESTLLPGRKVIPVIHPASALRQYMFSHYILLDLKRIAKEADTPDIVVPKRHIKISPTFSDVMLYMAWCHKAPEISYDIEVINQELSCIAFATMPDDVICIPFTHKGQPYFTPPDETEVMRQIADVLGNAEVKKIGQNLIFDSSFLLRKYGIVTRNMEDTMIGQGVLAPDFPKGLDFMCSIYTREPYYKDEGKQYIKWQGSDEDFWIYNAKDAAVTMECWYAIERDLIRLGNWETYERQRDLIHPLTYMAERGQRVDVEGMKHASIEAGEQADAMTLKLQEMCGFEINPGSVKQLKEYFYVTKGIKPYLNRKTGEITTDEKALKRLSRRGFKEAELILGIRGLNKTKSVYYDVQLDKDSRLRCSFNPVGAGSGRLSSSKDIFGVGTNVQNWPEKARRYIVADDGCAMYNIDLSQAENKVTAYIAPESKMIYNFEQGLDMHAYTASMIFEEPIEKIIADDKADVKCGIGNGMQTMRFWGKKSNHSFDYGEGYKMFAFYCEIPEPEAKYIWVQWHKIYPGIDQYWSWVRDSLQHDNRTLTNCFGRRRRFQDRWGDQLFKQAYSFIPQSTVADKINRHGLLYIYQNQDKFHGVQLLNQVHDSLVFQIPTALGWSYHLDTLRLIVGSLEIPIQWKHREFVIPADVKVGNGLGETMQDIDIESCNESDIKSAYHKSIQE